MDNTQTITLDIMNDKTYDYIYTKQYDKGREIYFTIVDRGTPISLSGLNVGFELKKPDGNICVYTDTADPSVLAIEGNQVLLTLTDQMTVLSGKLPYQISLLDGEKIISTVTGFVWCEKSAVQYDDVESVSGGSLIEDIQHIDEKINGIMLCGEDPPTDDIGDENSRYVQIVDGKVVKEFTKYDGHWVDFPEGGGAGNYIGEHTYIYSDSADNLFAEYGESVDVKIGDFDPWEFLSWNQTLDQTEVIKTDTAMSQWANPNSNDYGWFTHTYALKIDPAKVDKVAVEITGISTSALGNVTNVQRNLCVGLKEHLHFYAGVPNTTPVYNSDADWIDKRSVQTWVDPQTGTTQMETSMTKTFNLSGRTNPLYLIITGYHFGFTLSKLEFIRESEG